ncbi:MAG TPA: hypothetical protein VMW48_03330, partial [Vicinamibacterales bacterium]|nr:hypothetical protein [Vicinamibacterales bacterium]
MSSPFFCTAVSARAALCVVALLALPGSARAGQREVNGNAGPAAGRLVAGAAARVSGERTDVEVLRDEVAALRQQLRDLSSELSALRGLLPAATATATATATASAAPVAGLAAQDAGGLQLPPEMLQAQVEELAQTKVQSSSRFPVTLSGTIVSNTVVNSGDANWLESPNQVGTASGGSMTSTMRQSRIGLDVQAIPVGSWQAKGSLILDFFGGTPGFVTGTVMGVPRLLYAFGRLEHAGTAIQVGQDHGLLAPRDPTSLAAFAFPQFFRSGNLYLRVPQVRLEQRLGSVTVKAGIVAPVAGDAAGPYTFAPVAGAGERSERPALESHVGFDRGDEDATGELHLGASGHYGWIRQAGVLGTASAGALDFLVRRGRLGVAGELFAADQLDAYGAGVGQPGRAEGGWIEARVAAATRLSVNGG